VDKEKDHDILIRIEERQETIKNDVAWIKSEMKELPKQKEKIKTLERVVWGALIASMVAAIKAFWSWG
jgi:hypothetical protein